MADPPIFTDRHIYRSHGSRPSRRRRLVALGVVLVAAVLALWGLVSVLSRGETAGSPQTAAKEAPSRAPSAAPSALAAEWSGPPSSGLRLKLRDTIVSASISPKSVVSTGTGYVFAQNMMYRHTMTVYDAKTLKLVKTIQDSVEAAAFRIKGHQGTLRGAPVEAAVTPDGRFMFVSQYSMYGDGFYREGHDEGSPASGYDKSFIYRVGLDDLNIDKVIRVGSVPKYVAVTPDQRYVLVSNWTSYSLSVVSVRRSRQVKEVYLGPYPRGIAVDPDSRYAYVAVMGSSDVARVDLRSFAVSWIRGVGAGPRHLCMSPDGKYLYVTCNAAGTVVKVDLRTRRVTDRVATGVHPRSMALAPDGRSLYVVNYDSNTMSKVRTGDMRVLQVVATNSRPIGVTYDLPTKSVWVCCYTGSIMVFRER
jgi:YVTN family beta-propeller protein